MTEFFERELRLMQLRFIGKILAGFTHESKNYLAIIKESAGLIEDMIKLGKSGDEASGQFLEIIHSIEEQIEKSAGLFKYLNRFSHRMDNQLSAFNCNEALEELLALVNRFANQKKITLVKDFRQDLPQIYGNPSMMQFLVFGYLEENLKSLDINSRIIIKTGAANGSITIKIIPEGNLLEAEREKEEFPYETYNTVLKQLQGQITPETGAKTFSFPLKVSDI
jgi:nitrogen-specific signal transduction histidine kinase